MYFYYHAVDSTNERIELPACNGSWHYISIDRFPPFSIGFGDILSPLSERILGEIYSIRIRI
jgi:hypothetical protein